MFVLAEKGHYEKGKRERALYGKRECSRKNTASQCLRKIERPLRSWSCPNPSFHYTTSGKKKFWELSRAPESSEQFVWLNRRYGETETQLSRSAIMPSTRADSSQNAVI